MSRRAVRSVFKGINDVTDPLFLKENGAYALNCDFRSGKLAPFKHDSALDDQKAIVGPGVLDDITDTVSTTAQTVVTIGAGSYRFNFCNRYSVNTEGVDGIVDGWIIDYNTYFCRYPIDAYDLMFKYRTQSYTTTSPTGTATLGLYKHVNGLKTEYQVGSIPPTYYFSGTLTTAQIRFQKKGTATADGFTPLASGTYAFAVTLVFDQNGWTFETAPVLFSDVVTAAETDHYYYGLQFGATYGDWASYPNSKYMRVYKLSGVTGVYELVVQHTLDKVTDPGTDIVVVTAGANNALWDGSLTDASDLGAEITTYFFAEETGDLVQFSAPPTIDGLCRTQYQGCLVGWKDTKLYWSFPGFPDAWPSQFSLNFPENITFVETGLTGLIVVTPNQVFNVYGTSPYAFTIAETNAKRGCVLPFGYGRWRGGVVYLNKEGVVLYSGVNSEIISKTIKSDGLFWTANYSVSTKLHASDDFLFFDGSTNWLSFMPESADITYISSNIGSYLNFTDDEDETYAFCLATSGATSGYIIAKYATVLKVAKSLTYVTGQINVDEYETKNFQQVEYDFDFPFLSTSGTPADLTITSTIYLDIDYGKLFFAAAVQNSNAQSTTKTMTIDVNLLGTSFVPPNKKTRTHRLPRMKKHRTIQLYIEGVCQLNSVILWS